MSVFAVILPMVVPMMDHHEHFSLVIAKTDEGFFGGLSGRQPEIRGAAGCAFGSGVGHGWPLSEAKWAGVEARCATEGRRTGVSPLREFRVGREGEKGTVYTDAVCMEVEPGRTGKRGQAWGPARDVTGVSR